MKKLLLIAGTIVFIGNITGQNNHDGFSPCTCSYCLKSTTETATLKGTVIDSKSGEVIPFAIIEILDPSSKGKAVSADENGTYFLGGINSGTYKMTVTCLGFKTVEQNITIQPGSITMNKIFMEEKIQVIACGYMVKEPKELVLKEGLNEIAAIAETSQGPVTGLEGHNFVEDPAIIYPNPVRDVMNVKSTDPITVIEILGINGQVVMEMDPRSTMDVSGLAAGTYYARIHFENIKDVQIEKILIVK